MNKAKITIKGCPLILSIEDIYRKIRNLKYRYINPEFRTLFPEEIDTYEPYVIREALNNAIAHQDYLMGGQINVVESFLAQAMVNLKMVDTIGSGIRKMFSTTEALPVARL